MRIENITETNTRTCKECGADKGTREFYDSALNVCKSCRKARAVKYRQTRQEEIAKRLADTPAPTSIQVLCPFCGVLCTGGKELYEHLQADHLLTSGRHEGKVLGLDVVRCLLCDKYTGILLYQHLAKAHGVAPATYLNQFPNGILYPYNVRKLAQGIISRHLPHQHNKRRMRSDALPKLEVKPKKHVHERQCPVCLKRTAKLANHVARKHPELSSMPLFDEPPVTITPVEAPVDTDHVVGLIMALRPVADVEQTWVEDRVYFLQTGNTRGPIKIGWSNRLRERVSSLQVACPGTMRVLGTVPGGLLEEQAIHRLFAPYGLRGEWFRPHPLLLEYILNAHRITRGELEEPQGLEGTEGLESTPETAVLDRYVPRGEGERFLAIIRLLEKAIAEDRGNALTSEAALRMVRENLGPGPETVEMIDLWAGRIRGPRVSMRRKAGVRIGEVFGRLTVIAAEGTMLASRKSKDKVRTWRCRCECGVEVVVQTAVLRSGRKKSCGCVAPKHLAKYQFGHGNNYWRRGEPGQERTLIAEVPAVASSADSQATPSEPRS